VVVVVVVGWAHRKNDVEISVIWAWAWVVDYALGE